MQSFERPWYEMDDEKVLGFLPDMIQGETLYSWTGHFHRVNGSASAVNSSRQLFGNVCAGLRPDIPSNLDHFSKVTDRAFGSVETLVYERSLVGFYAPFLPKVNVKRALQRMKGNSIKILRSDLNMKLNYFGTSSPLKACTQCILEDMNTFYISKWYLEHQWPAAWMCRKHHQPLQMVNYEVTSKNLGNLILPQDIKDNEWESPLKVTSSQKNSLVKLVDFCDGISRRKDNHLNLDILRKVYFRQAKSRGWININGSVNTKFWKAFCKYYPQLDTLPGFDCEKLHFDDQNFVLMPMRCVVQKQPPVRHFLLMAFLFESPAEFDIAYSRQSESVMGTHAFREVEQSSVDWQVELPRMIEQERFSISHAAEILNIELVTAECFLQAAGINYLKKTILGEVKGHQLLFHRGHYQKLIKKYSLDSINKLMNFPNSKFSWLRRHDFQWLIENSLPSVSEALLASKSEKFNTF